MDDVVEDGSIACNKFTRFMDEMQPCPEQSFSSAPKEDADILETQDGLDCIRSHELCGRWLHIL